MDKKWVVEEKSWIAGREEREREREQNKLSVTVKKFESEKF